LNDVTLYTALSNRCNKILLPNEVTQLVDERISDYKEKVAHLSVNAARERDSLADKLIGMIDARDLETAVAQQMNISSALSLGQVIQQDSSFATQKIRLLRRQCATSLVLGEHTKACLLRYSFVMSQGGPNAPPAPDRDQDWISCIYATSQRLATANMDHNLNAFSTLASTNPAPTLQLALLLHMDDRILSTLLLNYSNLLQEVNPIGRNIFHLAAECGNAGAIQVIQKSVSNSVIISDLINQRDPFGMTPILVAAHAGSLECLRVLERAGADCSQDVTLGQSALNLACGAGHLHIVEYLLNHRRIPFDVNSMSPPLINAATGGHREVCIALIEVFNANPSLTSFPLDGSANLGNTAAACAWDNGFTDLAKELALYDKTGLSTNQLRQRQERQADWTVTDYVTELLNDHMDG
jgi:Ankyrin repeats (3 copies)